MQLILQISTHDFLELDELCESVKKATNEKSRSQIILN